MPMVSSNNSRRTEVIGLEQMGDEVYRAFFRPWRVQKLRNEVPPDGTSVVPVSRFCRTVYPGIWFTILV